VEESRLVNTNKLCPAPRSNEEQRECYMLKSISNALAVRHGSVRLDGTAKNKGSNFHAHFS
jgi:hypothetical protein